MTKYSRSQCVRMRAEGGGMKELDDAYDHIIGQIVKIIQETEKSLIK